MCFQQLRGLLVVLSSVVEVFAFSQFLQHSCPELGPVFILELLDTQSQVEVSRVAAQERIVLLLLSDGGGALEGKCTVKKQPSTKMLCMVSLVHAAATMICMQLTHLQKGIMGSK